VIVKTSTERILTTHTGSLPRPESVLPEGADPVAVAAADPDVLREAVALTVDRQLDAGIDVVNDGEVSKISYATYVTSRLSGFGAASDVQANLVMADMAEFPRFVERTMAQASSALGTIPACVGPVGYEDPSQVERDVANLRAATDGSRATEVFMSAASPGVIAVFQPNRHYKTEEEYVFALADAMKTEYDLIHEAGLLLQLDCPDLAMDYHIRAHPEGREAFVKSLGPRVEALNHATRDIPSDRLRMHLCWGNYEGPHHHDIPLADVVGEVLKARPMAISFEAANPRHEHEWTLFEDLKLPDDKVLIPGVIDSTSNYIEHPDLVAQRLERYARLVGQERVMAGSDCGFATFASMLTVDPAITWVKLAAMAEGASRASQRLATGSTATTT
jgi:5-methyltetrahydropteroyltriglutamate--homocysteine methyltransferase